MVVVQYTVVMRMPDKPVVGIPVYVGVRGVVCKLCEVFCDVSAQCRVRAALCCVLCNAADCVNVLI